MIVGIPKEIKPAERRVGFTPHGVSKLRAEGIPVWVEKGCGSLSGFSDEQYQEAGALLVANARELYGGAELILKVKEPLPNEYPLLEPRHVLFSFLHLSSPANLPLLNVLMKQKVTAFGFETITKEGRTVLLEPMSEIAGTLVAYFSAFLRQYVTVDGRKIIYPPRFLEKMELLAGQFPGVPERLHAGKTAVFGGGVVGEKAAQMILKMDGEVDLIEKNPQRREELRKKMQPWGRRFRVWGLEENFFPNLEEAHAWIGAVHVAGEKAPLVLSAAQLESLSRQVKKIILDVAVDQGGNFPETRSTTYEEPLYLDTCGNWRFGVPNLPALCGHAASEQIEKAASPYVSALAQDWRKVLRENPELRSGLQILQGRLVHEAVARAHNLSYEKIDAGML